MAKRYLGLMALGLAAALSLGGPQPAAAQDRSRELVWGDTLPAGLDPHVIYDVPMQFVLLNVYDGLYRYKGNPPELIPWLAESHTVTPDGLTWRFTLRRGVKFHDGSELTAADVVYSFQRLLRLNRGPAGAFTPVLKPDNVTAPESHVVQFVLDSAYAPFLAAVPLVAIVNPRVLRANETNNDWGAAWLASNSAGSGAYRLDGATYRPRELADMPRFADHFMGWGHVQNPVEMIRARPIQETTTRVLALLRGETDATDSYLPTDQVERIQRAPNVRVSRDESMRVMIIRMNNTKPPFDNADFRRCVSHAFNYPGFITGILKDFAVRNAGPNPQNLWGTPRDLPPYAYDLTKAREHCDKARAAGAPVGRELEIHIQSELDQTTQAAQLLQGDLRRLGVNLRIVPSTWPRLTSGTNRAETTPDMWVHWVSTYFVDPENWIGQMYDSQFHGTWKASSWYKNPRVDELLRRARTSTDRAVRQAAYEEASRIVVADAADIWIYNTIQLRGLNNRVQGYTFSPVGSGGEIRYLSLARQ